MFEQKGPGWRLSKDLSRQPFSVLIGGENWAVELTESEGLCLASVITELAEQHHRLKEQLMDEESICIEMEKGPWWGCLEGDKFSWSLQAILTGDSNGLRGIEFSWPSPVAESVGEAMRIMWDSCN